MLSSVVSPNRARPIENSGLLLCGEGSHSSDLTGNADGAFQLRPVPMAALGGGRIGAREKLKHQGIRRLGSTNRLVWQDELSKFRIEVGPCRDRSVAKARRFGVGIGVERGGGESIISRPESGAAH